jgi:Immunity protein 26
VRKNYIKLGDIILIPINGEQCAVAKIIYLSKYFKDLILLSVYPLFVKTLTKSMELPPSINNELLIYTGNQKIKKDEWIKIQNVPVNEEEKKLSKRIVGGEVWIEDECIGTATEEDRETLERMGVDGAKLVENKIKDYFIKAGLM